VPYSVNPREKPPLPRSHDALMSSHNLEDDLSSLTLDVMQVCPERGDEVC
jgi:hypothetical protein